MTRITALAAVSMFLGSALLESQSFQGGIRGTVADTSGAVVVMARVTLTDESTGTARITLSNDQGQYAFSAVNPATYTVSAESPRIQDRDQEKGMVVEDTAVSYCRLATARWWRNRERQRYRREPLLETNNALTGQLIDNQKLVDLPNMGRNPFFEGVKPRRTWSRAAIRNSIEWKINPEARKSRSMAVRLRAITTFSMGSRLRIQPIMP